MLTKNKKQTNNSQIKKMRETPTILMSVHIYWYMDDGKLYTAYMCYHEHKIKIWLGYTQISEGDIVEAA